MRRSSRRSAGPTAPPVDGVGAGQPDTAPGQFPGHGLVAEHALHAALGVVKVAVDGVHRHIVPGLGDHLQPLDLTGTVVGVEHLDLHPIEAGISGQRRLAGVARGGHQNPGPLGAAQVLFGLDQQLRHDLQRIVLEGAGRAMPEFQRKEPVGHRFDLAGLAGKRRAVGLLCRLLQKGGVILCQKAAQHRGRQLRIGKMPPGIQLRPSREGLRHKQPAVRRQAPNNGFGGRNNGVAVACALVLHIFPLSLGVSENSSALSASAGRQRPPHRRALRSIRHSCGLTLCIHCIRRIFQHF